MPENFSRSKQIQKPTVQLAIATRLVIPWTEKKLVMDLEVAIPVSVHFYFRKPVAIR